MYILVYMCVCVHMCPACICWGVSVWGIGVVLESKLKFTGWWWGRGGWWAGKDVQREGLCAHQSL